jgi:hypothetical protein
VYLPDQLSRHPTKVWGVSQCLSLLQYLGRPKTIGQFTADGCIQIVGRKKNLVKLMGGEYVAVEAMETAFATSSYSEALCVIANGDQPTSKSTNLL